MTGRSPARLLAPTALVVSAVALFAVLSSGGGDESSSTGATPTATVTATATAKKKKSTSATKRASTYTVKPGDTPSGIAEQLGVDVGALLDANPDVSPGSLRVGEKLKVPRQ